MLTKYWSGFLIAGLALAALVDRRRADYFRSAAPWLTAAAFIVAVLPHVVWLVQMDFPPMRWVVARREAESVSQFLHSLATYVGGTLGYSLPALALVAILVHPSPQAVRDSWFARDPSRRTATVLFWTPLLLPILVASATRTNLQSVWNEPSLNLLPVMMLASALVVVPRIALKRVAAFVVAITAVILASSPIVALVILKNGVENNAAYARLAAETAETEWKLATDRPLRLVAGTFALASAAAFYIADKPSTFADFSPYLSPWVDAGRIAREGVAVICPADDTYCLDHMKKLESLGPAGARAVAVTLTRHWLGFAGEPRKFVIAAVPPRP